MNCTDAKHLIHLDVGNDLRTEEESLLASHMEECGDCRTYHVRMSCAMSALVTLRDEPSMIGGQSAGVSVWPTLSREIKRRSRSTRVAKKFNLQVVALSVCSLSLAAVTMVQSLSSMRTESSWSDLTTGISVLDHKNSGPPQYHSLRNDQRLHQDNTSFVTPMLPHDAPVVMPQSF